MPAGPKLRDVLDQATKGMTPARANQFQADLMQTIIKAIPQLVERPLQAADQARNQKQTTTEDKKDER